MIWGHGEVLGLQRKGNALLLWISWSHYSGGTRKTDLVRNTRELLDLLHSEVPQEDSC